MKHYLIIGAGVTGLSIASKLSGNPNLSVTVIDKLDFVGGASSSFKSETKSFAGY